MAVYEGYKIYGPYKRSDNRMHCVLIKHDDSGSIIDRKTVSYPKLIVEQFLGRYLDPTETVDHIDEDFSNNALSNLRVVPRSEHCRSHTSSKPLLKKKCVICGSEFETYDINKVTCGSKHCAGCCAHIKGYNKGNDFTYNSRNALISNRSLIREILSVEAANSGKSLVDNPEQDS